MSSHLRSGPTATAGAPTVLPSARVAAAPAHATLAAKRLLDVVLGGTLLLIGSPFWLAVAVYVKSTSRGPVLFRQTRLGRRGVPFRIYKFRTMRADAEAVLRANPRMHARHVAGGHKLPDHEDPRITRAGRLLRRAGLDEVPQLLNVLKGEMSLVGPRPLVPEEGERYPELVDLVESLRPGITGPWQLGRFAPGDYALRAEMDLAYVTAPSLRADLRILLLTSMRAMRPGR